MGVESKNGDCSLRTIWTPEMDKHFTELMVEKVVKGNRTDDQLFSKCAWQHMTAKFNAKFSSKYEKDVLKNRHKTLRNLYRSLKNLLEQEGFKWDEERQMVAADDEVWDEYIKEHPEARAFKVKAIPHYSDLCKIYENVDIGGKDLQNADINENMSQSDVGSSLEGGKSVHKNVGDLLEYSSKMGETTVEPVSVTDMASESLHDILIDEDYRISVDKGTVDDTCQDIGSPVNGRTRTYWQPPMDRYFVNLMLEHVNKGNQVDGIFRKQAWREMVLSFNAKFGFNFEVDILKNRYKTLRRQHNVIKDLLKLDGFAWDNKRQMVIADDRVWQEYIKAHTDVRQYMTRPLPYFQDLCLICRDLNTGEKDSSSSHQNLETLNKEHEIKIVTVNQSPAVIASSDQFYKENVPSLSDLTKTATNQTRKRLQIPPIARCSKRSRTGDEGVVPVIHEMAITVSSLGDKGKEYGSLNAIPVETVVAAIQALPDMDDDLVLDACDFLEDEKKAKIFLALDFKLRKKWLLRKLRPSQ